jgi:hypothetical protein
MMRSCGTLRDQQLVFHFGRSSWSGGRPPSAFSKQGVAMLSSRTRGPGGGE